jgi:hypothetical protein
MAHLEEYQRCNKNEDILSSGDLMPHLPRPRTGWYPPLSGLKKVNWNASINITKECIGIDVVARNSIVNVLGAKSLTEKVVAIPKLAEAMAAYEAVVFCKEVGFYDIILEGDAKQVVDDVNSRTPNQNVAGHFVEGIIMEMQGL